MVYTIRCGLFLSPPRVTPKNSPQIRSTMRQTSGSRTLFSKTNLSQIFRRRKTLRSEKNEAKPQEPLAEEKSSQLTYGQAIQRFPTRNGDTDTIQATQRDGRTRSNGAIYTIDTNLSFETAVGHSNFDLDTNFACNHAPDMSALTLESNSPYEHDIHRSAGFLDMETHPNYDGPSEREFNHPERLSSIDVHELIDALKRFRTKPCTNNVAPAERDFIDPARSSLQKVPINQVASDSTMESNRNSTVHDAKQNQQKQKDHDINPEEHDDGKAYEDDEALCGKCEGYWWEDTERYKYFAGERPPSEKLANNEQERYKCSRCGHYRYRPRKADGLVVTMIPIQTDTNTIGAIAM